MNKTMDGLVFKVSLSNEELLSQGISLNYAVRESTGKQ